MLQERNHARSHGDQLLRRHVHVVDLVRRAVNKVTTETAGHKVSRKIALLINRLIRLGNVIFFLQITGQVIDGVGHTALGHLSVRALDKAEVVHSGECGQAGDQTNVWAFRCLHRTNPTVVRGVHVAHLEPGTFPGQTAGAKR